MTNAHLNAKRGNLFKRLSMGATIQKPRMDTVCKPESDAQIRELTPAARAKTTAKQNCVLRQDRKATVPVARTSGVN